MIFERLDKRDKKQIKFFLPIQAVNYNKLNAMLQEIRSCPKHQGQRKDHHAQMSKVIAFFIGNGMFSIQVPFQ